MVSCLKPLTVDVTLLLSLQTESPPRPDRWHHFQTVSGWEKTDEQLLRPHAGVCGDHMVQVQDRTGLCLMFVLWGQGYVLVRSALFDS